MESIPTLGDSKTLRGADSNPGPHLSEQSIPTAERVPMGNEEEVNEASPLVELCKAPPRIQRSTSITSPGYYDWRRRLWSEVGVYFFLIVYLEEGDTLSLFYKFRDIEVFIAYLG